MGENQTKHFSSCPIKNRRKGLLIMYRQSIIKSRRRIHSKTETCIKHSLVSYEVNFIQSGAVTKRQAGFRLSYHWHSKLCWECPHAFRNTSVEMSPGCGAWLARTQAACPHLPRASPRSSAEVEVLLWLAGEQGWWRAGAPGSGLLCGDKLHDHADNSRTSRTRTQVRAWVFNFILEELVKFTAKFLYQFSYLQWKCSVSCAGRKGEGFHREISNHEYHSAVY